MATRPVAVHSVDHFVFTVPDIEVAQKFYTNFGLDVRRSGNRIDLYAFGNPHRWGSIFGNGKTKKIGYISLGIYEEDAPAFRARIEQLGLGCAPHELSDGQGLWLRNPDGVPFQLKVAPKVSPTVKAQQIVPSATPGKGAAPSRSGVEQVRPRHLSHVLCFSPDVPRMLKFGSDVLGLKLSDRSQDIIAFMHTPHGSDHHLMAFAKSDKPGFHHSSWDVRNLHEVGAGGEQMRNQGYNEGWGVGRHVLGSNYFHYVRDPWGSFAEYSYDIDHVPAGMEWPAADHPPEDSLYVWGPPVPDYFIQNHET